ncbi:hypothetical protein GCM10009838_14720 [Catenulispora subtropica]|uniref:Uncharacterized protein n=1 Tax=Catenulispora subtropica TaxID=450798 RepID=A0ABP5CAQ8_9ACTN
MAAIGWACRAIADSGAENGAAGYPLPSGMPTAEASQIRIRSVGQQRPAQAAHRAAPGVPTEAAWATRFRGTARRSAEAFSSAACRPIVSGLETTSEWPAEHKAGIEE